jgi:FlaA1/EpsC-like NDP-sugar epimerase
VLRKPKPGSAFMPLSAERTVQPYFDVLAQCARLARRALIEQWSAFVEAPSIQLSGLPLQRLLERGTRQVLIITAAYWWAWLLRFDFQIPASEMPLFIQAFAIVVAVKMGVAIVAGLPHERWDKHQGFADVTRLLALTSIESLATSVAIYAAHGAVFPRSVYILDPILCLAIGGGVRFIPRARHELRVRLSPPVNERGLLVYGAGVAGLALAREIRENPSLGYRVLGFLDDDLNKVGTRVMGLPVLGVGEDAPRVVKNLRDRGDRVEEIVVAMPSASGRQVRTAQTKGSRAACCRIVPGLGELISGKLSVAKMREISVTDLLGRDQVELDLEGVRRSVAGRAVLVTGGAGSIGTELCHQLATYEPRVLIALDQAESELFRLEADLRAKCPDVNLVCEVGDIRDARQIEQLIEYYSVDSIFHAAAYKHVPIMERQICEAVRNNIIGTWILAQAAWRAGVSTFVMISTDKAVNPSSIMGLTKRVAELIVSAERSVLASGATKFVSVRFGNVLVSNGSVVPTFKKQIASGGPVTVTHPDMRRYFMTVQEAVQLVLQASTMGKGSDVFVLDMGQEVRIVDLARHMIRLAGFVPDEDIEIRFTGLRPGEKLFEEISFEREDIVPTECDRIRVFKGHRVAFADLVPWVAELHQLLSRRKTDNILQHLALLVPEYSPSTADPAPCPMPQTHVLGRVDVPLLSQHH